AEQLIREPAHPYTRALLRVVPRPRQRESKRLLLQGETPDPTHIPGGCRFHPRCPEADRICREEEPAFSSLGVGRKAACHHLHG
ncbi:MAG TPA: oligopeptide ABC transporter ATP-binding protein, partial [Firmicutes bacterium]|nr:oligopeptide ABC transporter ATP-binding protein [Bacillota bacterium]